MFFSSGKKTGTWTFNAPGGPPCGLPRRLYRTKIVRPVGPWNSLNLSGVTFHVLRVGLIKGFLVSLMGNWNRGNLTRTDSGTIIPGWGRRGGMAPTISSHLAAGWRDMLKRPPFQLLLAGTYRLVKTLLKPLPVSHCSLLVAKEPTRFLTHLIDSIESPRKCWLKDPVPYFLTFPSSLRFFLQFLIPCARSWFLGFGQMGGRRRNTGNVRAQDHERTRSLNRKPPAGTFLLAFLLLLSCPFYFSEF